MLKKPSIFVALATLALIAGPTAAHAQGNVSSYVPQDQVVATGSPTPGGESTVAFREAFLPGEQVSFAVTGATSVTLSAAQAQITTTLVKTASEAGSTNVVVAFPANASGSYSVTATGAESGSVATAQLDVVPADAGTGSGTGSSDNLAATGGSMNTLLVWGGAGALILGAALVMVLRTVRRQS